MCPQISPSHCAPDGLKGIGLAHLSIFDQLFVLFWTKPIDFGVLIKDSSSWKWWWSRYCQKPDSDISRNLEAEWSRDRWRKLDLRNRVQISDFVGVFERPYLRRYLSVLDKPGIRIYLLLALSTVVWSDFSSDHRTPLPACTTYTTYTTIPICLSRSFNFFVYQKLYDSTRNITKMCSCDV